MKNYPSSHAEVYYLMRKEIRERPDLPALNLDDIRIITNLFWKQLRAMFKQKETTIHLAGFLMFQPRLKQIKKYNEKKNRQRENYEKKKKGI